MQERTKWSKEVVGEEEVVVLGELCVAGAEDLVAVSACCVAFGGAFRCGGSSIGSGGSRLGECSEERHVECWGS